MMEGVGKPDASSLADRLDEMTDAPRQTCEKGTRAGRNNPQRTYPMSFRDNLQHLRATRNMTQEQLAMLLGVSRQSVSKWEAERAYPEMDKLLKLCDLFGCTLDDLVTGDLTGRPADKAASMPPAKAHQDVTGYDQAMRAFAHRVSLGVAIPILGMALAMLLPGLAPVPEMQNYASVLMLAGAAVGLALILPAFFARNSFRKAHPFVEDFYTADQKSRARSTMLIGLVAGIALVIAGLAATMLPHTPDWLATTLFTLLGATGAFLIVRGCLLGSRCNVDAYNEKSFYDMADSEIAALDDPALRAHARRAKRDRGIFRFVMLLSTAVGLVLLFVPALHAQRWFWLSWVVGGVLHAAIRAFRSTRSDE